MLSYSIADYTLTLTVAGAVMAEPRAQTLIAISTDPAVPVGCVLLLHVERTTESFDESELAVRLTGLIRAMGPRMTPVCAVIGPSTHILEAHLFQRLAAEAGLRVGLFRDEPSARTWLSGYVAELPE